MGGVELWTPPRLSFGGDAHVIGGGPSLRGFDFGLLAGALVIGCNDAWELGAEICPYLLFGDESWWLANRARVVAGYRGTIVSCAPGLLRAGDPVVNVMLRIPSGLGIGNQLAWNYSTGAAAINLAISMGARRVFALGFDCGHRASDPSHWHDRNTAAVSAYTRERFVSGLSSLARALPDGVEVVRVTGPESAPLDVFQTMPLECYKESLLEHHQKNAAAESGPVGILAES